MQRYVPASITDAIKQGFSAPDASWFRGESIEYVRRMLLDRKARIYSFLDYEAVKQLIEEHLKGATNRRLLIWSLLSVESWCVAFG
jgi:asparagine synthase (glutamine-hydrolysing)